MTVVNPVTAQVDWGDGVIMNYVNALNIEHSYKAYGNYTITFLSFKSGVFKFIDITELTEIMTPLPRMETDDYSQGFSGCVNLRLIPYGLFGGNHSISNMEGLFEDCTSLRHIPKGIFRGLISLNNVKRTFAGSGISEIDGDIFEDAVSLTDLYETFAGCVNLVKIPSRLIYKNVSLEALTGTFSCCSSIKLVPSMLMSLPKLFNGIESGIGGTIKSFERTFENCLSLDAVGGDIFGIINDTFYNDSFTYKSMFKGCVNLRSVQFAVESQLFVPLGNTGTNFESMFGNCLSLKGAAPDQMWLSTGTNGTNCFAGCNNLSNYADIPNEWR
jgi:hypothetical protein